LNDYKFVLAYDDIRFSWLFGEMLKEGYSTALYSERVNLGNRQAVYLLSPKRSLTPEFLYTLQSGSKFFAYSLPNECKDMVKEKQLTPYLYSTDCVFLHLNAKLTAEGLTAYIINNTDMCLSECRIFVLGGGRIAKNLAHYLLPLSPKTSFATKDKEEYAQLYTWTKNVYSLKDIVKVVDNYDIIVNTIPKQILSNTAYGKMSKSATILEVTNCGINKVLASKNGIRVITLSGIPSTTAPKTAATILKECVLRQLQII